MVKDSHLHRAPQKQNLQAEYTVGTHVAKQLKPQVRSTLHVAKRLVQLLPTAGQRLQYAPTLT